MIAVCSFFVFGEGIYIGVLKKLGCGNEITLFEKGLVLGVGSHGAIFDTVFSLVFSGY